MFKGCTNKKLCFFKKYIFVNFVKQVNSGLQKTKTNWFVHVF